MSSLAMNVGGLFASVAGSYFSAKSEKILAEGQARIAEINARISEMGAQQELIQGQREIGRMTLQAGQLKGRQRVAMAANGVDLGVGNAAEIAASTEILKEIDKNTLQANAVRSAWGYRTQAMNFQNEAIGARAKAASISPGTAAFSSLLTGATQVAEKWMAMNKTGIPPKPSPTPDDPNKVTPDDLLAANKSDDPIGALGNMKNWW